MARNPQAPLDQTRAPATAAADTGERASASDPARDLAAPIFIAGHRGMVGSALVRRLTALGYTNLLTATHAELDLLDQAAVNRFFADHAIDQVYLAAARVGGIHANNTYPADFIYRSRSETRHWSRQWSRRATRAALSDHAG